MKRAAIIGAIVGALIPLGIWVAYMFFGYMAGTETVIIWPSSIVLMGLEYQKSMSIAIVAWLGSALINIILYAFLAVCFPAIYMLINKRSHNA